jgi:hypothetical protein
VHNFIGLGEATIYFDHTDRDSDVSCGRLADPKLQTKRFTRWKEYDAYQKALNRLLRDLRVEKA